MTFTPSWKLGLLLVLVALGLAPIASARPARDWKQPQLLSDPAVSVVAAAPDLAVDGEGNPHVTWYSVVSGSEEQGGGLVDAIIYRGRIDGVWSAPEPIVLRERPNYGDTSSPLVSDAALRNPQFALTGALASAPDGRLHLTIGSGTSQQYLHAPWREVVRMVLLLPPVSLGAASSSAIASDDNGAIHIALSAPPRRAEPATQPGARVCAGCLDLLYRRSEDGGLTWTRAENLSWIEGTHTSPQIAADGLGQVHLLWEYRNPGQPDAPALLLYRRSADGGWSWGEPALLGAPGESVRLPALGVAPDGRLLAVYTGESTGSVFFQASSDGGQSWSSPGLVPGVVSPGVTETAGRHFSLAADGAGRLHLLMVGAVPAGGEQGQQLLHLSWDGQSWSAPEVLPGGAGTPGSPRLAMERGNRLHAVWAGAELDADGGLRQAIWHSSVSIDAPELAPAPTFTPLPITLPTPTVVSTPTPSPTPLPVAVRAQQTLDGPPRWEAEGLAILFLSLGPVLLLFGAVVWWAYRRGSPGD